MRKKTLWRAPLFCAAAGMTAFYAVAFPLGRFILVTLPDGAVTADITRQRILYGGILLTTLLTGGLAFFRGMTRKELFLSASIAAAPVKKERAGAAPCISPGNLVY